MFEPKPLASLNAGLLARKGEAHPATRRAHVPPAPTASLPPKLADSPPSPPPVHRQQERIAQSFGERETMPVAQSVVPSKGRTAFTLRLDADRHLRLRLACAVGNRSAQQVVTEALDAFLDRQPGLDSLAAQAGKLPFRR